MMDNGVAVAIRTMMRRTPLRRLGMLMGVVVFGMFGIVGGTVRHQHSRADRNAIRTAQLQEPI